jgi:hypothetical protein
MELNVAVVDWKTVLARRKEVPLQKACIAVPWRVVAIIWICHLSYLSAGLGWRWVRVD